MTTRSVPPQDENHTHWGRANIVEQRKSKVH